MRTPQGARAYLREHMYALTQGNDKLGDPHPTITYQHSTGDGTWESDVSQRYGWERLSTGQCCAISNSRHCSQSNYCAECGTGMNRNESWRKHAQDEIEATEDLSEELPQAIQRRMRRSIPGPESGSNFET